MKTYSYVKVSPFLYSTHPFLGLLLIVCVVVVVVY